MIASDHPTPTLRDELIAVIEATCADPTSIYDTIADAVLALPRVRQALAQHEAIEAFQAEQPPASMDAISRADWSTRRVWQLMHHLSTLSSPVPETTT